FALTAQVLPEERKQLLNKGFNAILMKPFREKDLVNVLKTLDNQTYDDTATVVNGSMVEDFEFDIDKVQAMTFGDREQTLEILEIVIEESKKDLARMRILLASSEREELTLLIHRMAGRVSQIGAKSLSAEYRKLEIQLEENMDLEVLSSIIKESLLKGLNYIHFLETYVSNYTKGEVT